MDFKKYKRMLIANLKVLFLLTALCLCVNMVFAAQWEVGEGQTYKTIQSAIDNVNIIDGDTINVHNGTYYEDVIVNKKLTIKANNGDNVEIKSNKIAFSIINNSIGDGSGSIIEGFRIINSIGGTGINISANDCNVRNNYITNGSIGISIFGNNSLVKNNSMFNVLEKGIQLGTYFFINDSGISKQTRINSNNGIVENNSIIGGLIGIDLNGDNSVVKFNKISQLKEIGINIFGSTPTIIGNVVKDMIGIGKKAAIQIASINIEGSTGLIVDGNNISNIRSTNDTSVGIDTFIMGMNSKLKPVQVLRNNISSVYGFGKTTGISVVPLSLGGPLSIIDVSKNILNNLVAYGENSTTTAITLVPMGFSKNKIGGNDTTKAEKLLVSKNTIDNLFSKDLNGVVKGISLVQLFSGNSSILKNNLKNFQSNAGTIGITVTGIDYTNFNSNISISQNNLSNFISKGIGSGIQVINLGNSNIYFNNIFDIKGKKTKYLAVMTIVNGKNIVKGNNLEGTGVGEGISVMGNNNIINYNRIVNFRHNIENINFSDLVEFSQGRPLPTDKEIRAYILSKNGTYVNGTLINISEEDVQNIIKSYHKIIDNLSNLAKSKTDARYNWYGTNKPSKDKFLKGLGTLDYSPWLILKINTNPSTIKVNQRSKITADVYTDSYGNYHGKNSSMFFSGPSIIFRTNLGNVGSKYITVNWFNGLAFAILRGDEGPGIATVSATDFETVKTFVKIIGFSDKSKNKTEVKAITVKNTGTSLIYLPLALFVIISSLVYLRRK